MVSCSVIRRALSPGRTTRVVRRVAAHELWDTRYVEKPHCAPQAGSHGLLFLRETIVTRIHYKDKNPYLAVFLVGIICPDYYFPGKSMRNCCRYMSFEPCTCLYASLQAHSCLAKSIINSMYIRPIYSAGHAPTARHQYSY